MQDFVGHVTESGLDLFPGKISEHCMLLPVSFKDVVNHSHSQDDSRRPIACPRGLYQGQLLERLFEKTLLGIPHQVLGITHPTN